MVRGRIAGGLRAREIPVLPRRVPHFGHGIPFRDEPGADAGRDFANRTRFERVDADTVELVFLWRDFNSDSQLPTSAIARYTGNEISAVVASNSKRGTQ